MLLLDKKTTRIQLRTLIGLSAVAMAKLAKGENVHTDVVLCICEALDCDLIEIIELEK